MTDYVTIAIVTVVIIAGLFLFYKALKEPFDHFFHFLGWAFRGIGSKVSDMAGRASSKSAESVQRVITYD